MKNERLFSIVNLLLEKGRMGAPELSRRFEVSPRTIYRDMDSLSASGVPIVALPGADGGYEIAEGFRIDRSFLSGSEIDGITGTLRGFQEALKDPLLATSLGKLSGLGARPLKDGALPVRGPHGASSGKQPSLLRKRDEPGNDGAISGASSLDPIEFPPPLIVTLSPWGGPSPDAAVVECCRRAIAEHHHLLFSYSDSQAVPTERIVEAFSLVLGGPVWYLHAFCTLRSDFRLFRLSRMRSLKLEESRFDPEARLPVPEPFSTGDNEPMIRIRIEAAQERRNDLVEAFGEEALSVSKSGRIVAGFSYPKSEWLLRFLLQLGPSIVVREPEWLSVELSRAAAEIARNNSR